MAEMTGTTTTPVSDVMLARYVAGDLQGEQLARVERAIGETPGLAERLERMRSERAEFLASAPPHQFAHQVVTRLTVERPKQPKWQVWWLLPPVTVATALLFGVVYQRALGPQSLSRPAVATDEAYQLPEDAKPMAAEPGVAAEEPRRQAEADAEPLEAKAVARDPATAKASTPATRDAAKNKGIGGGGGAGGLADADKQVAPRREDREHARKKEAAPLGDLAADGLGQGSYGVGRGGEGAGTGKSYAQPPPAAKPTAVQPQTPPVWAAPPPPAPAQPSARAERRSASAPADRAAQSESAEREANSATKTPAAAAPTATPAPEPPPPPRPEPSTASSGPSAAGAVSAPPAKVMKDEAKADEKGRTRPAEAAKAKSVAEDDSAGNVATVVGISRDVGGRARGVSAGEVVPSGTLLKVTAQGGRYVTVIGVRRDGVPHVYGQAESPSGQAVTVPVRLRPASSRVSEALFVVLGDAPLADKTQVSGGKDAAQLPLRLAVPGAQRRYVLTLSATAD